MIKNGTRKDYTIRIGAAIITGVILIMTSLSTVVVAHELPLSEADELLKERYLNIEDGKVEFAPGELLVKFAADVPIATDIASEDGIIITGVSSIDQLAQKHQVTSIEQVKVSDDVVSSSAMYKLLLSDAADPLEIANEFESDPNIECAEPNYLFQTCAIPDDSLFDLQWALHNTGQTGGSPDADIDAPEAWDIETGDEDVVIAFIDTGIDYSHRDLVDNIWVNDDELVDGTDTDGNGYIDDVRGLTFFMSDIDPNGEPGSYSPYGLWKDEDDMWHFRFQGSSLKRYFGSFRTDVQFLNVTPVNLAPDECTINNTRIGFDVRRPSSSGGFDFELPTTGMVLTFDVNVASWTHYGWVATLGKIAIGAGEEEVISPFVYIFGNSPFDDVGHGTHCAGIASAMTNNDQGIAGVCWNCTLMPIKAFDSRGWGYLDDLVESIYYAVDNGADVISMSWGNYGYSALLEEAIQYASSNGVVLVGAAGNENTYHDFYPGRYNSVIAVAATKSNDAKASFSNYGYWVDVAAPGVEIYSTLPRNGYGRANGTSMAGPHVAGLVALLLSKNPDLTSDMIKTIIANTCDPIDTPVYVGRGRINAFGAIQREPVIACIDAVPYGEDVKGVIAISGSVWRETFNYWVVEVGRGKDPDTWVEITNSSKPIDHGTLTTLNTKMLDDGLITIRLRLVCPGEEYTDMITVVVNNEYSLFIVDDEGVPEDGYTVIQDAVDDAGQGDTVYVRNGTYFEKIVIFKAIEFLGEDKQATLINSEQGDPFYCDPGVITVFADGVTISGFHVTQGLTGICIRSNANMISGNKVTNASYGISLTGVTTNTITNNTLKYVGEGLYLQLSRYNILSGNTITWGNGGYLLWSDNNTITENFCSCMTIGFYFMGCSYNTISKNTITFDEPPPGEVINNYGIALVGDSNPYGLWEIRASNNNIISGNTVSNKTRGIYIFTMRPGLIENNIVYYNNLINNIGDARDEGNNFWDNGYPSGGNFWDDHDGVDMFHGPDQDIPGPDGISDTHYFEDAYPLMNPWIPPYIPKIVETID